jgi:hypothetical protein
MRIFGHRKEPPKQSPEEAVLAVPSELRWLLDAPLFIDQVQVEAFYDAILRPELDQTALELSNGSSNQFGGSLGFSLGALAPGLSASRTTTHDETTSYTVVSNPYRHLLSVALHYYRDLPGRMKAVTYVNTDGSCRLEGGGEPPWYDAKFISDTPRALLFMDLPPLTKFIPAAAEVTGADVCQIFDAVGEQFAKASRTKLPPYPGGAPDKAEERRQYWDWFSRNFDATVATRAVEVAASGQPFNWVAYRVALPGAAEPFLHLWVEARGKYDTGTFAYNFVKRGFKHGMRLVGTLKSEPDMNVLAVFEK